LLLGAVVLRCTVAAGLVVLVVFTAGLWVLVELRVADTLLRVAAVLLRVADTLLRVAWLALLLVAETAFLELLTVAFEPGACNLCLGSTKVEPLALPELCPGVLE